MNEFKAFLARHPMGYVTAKDLPELIRIHRLCQCLVRCGCCRFVAAAQDVAHLIKAIEAIGDYVRDVAITTIESESADKWQAEFLFFPAAKVTADVKQSNEDVYTVRMPRKDFNESDCGGVVDGMSNVTSDADSGL